MKRQYFKIDPNPDCSHTKPGTYGLENPREVFMAAKWYQKEGHHPDEWFSEPEIFNGSNNFGFYFGDSATFTPVCDEMKLPLDEYGPVEDEAARGPKGNPIDVPGYEDVRIHPGNETLNIETLSKREEFAARAMAGICASPLVYPLIEVRNVLKLEDGIIYDPTIHWPQFVALMSVRHADALLSELSKTPKS